MLFTPEELAESDRREDKFNTLIGSITGYSLLILILATPIYLLVS